MKMTSNNILLVLIAIFISGLGIGGILARIIIWILQTRTS